MAPPWFKRATWFCFVFFTGTRAWLLSPTNFRLDAIFETSKLQKSRAQQRNRRVSYVQAHEMSHFIPTTKPTWRRIDINWHLVTGLWRIISTVRVFVCCFGGENENVSLFFFYLLVSLAFRDTGSPPKFAECSSCGRTFNPSVLVSLGFIVCFCCTLL